jgi:hypothetical protein
MWEMKVQIMERKTWEKVSRATEMENSMTYAKRAIQHPPARLANR